MIDRVAPSYRPPRRNDGTQRWESLLFSHWEIPFEIIRPLVPKPLEIDAFEGTTYIGIVPFKMRNIRTRWLPRGLTFNFLETNVRTYVYYQGQPGVFFLSLDASSLMAVIAARLGWSLPYHFATMSCEQQADRYHYKSSRRVREGRHDVAFRVADQLGPSVEGTLEHFLLERYLMFTQRESQVQVGQVHHDPYIAYLAEVEDVSDRLAVAAGLPRLARQPDLAHYCPAVDVEVFGFERA